jgi:hypothetical protein
MEVKRRKEIFIETRRRLIVYLPEAAEKIFCPICQSNELLISAEQTAAYLGINRRIVYRMVETETTVHFIETETGILLVCLNSLQKVLDKTGDSNLNLPIKEKQN